MEIQALAKMSSKGQVTIPASIRELLKLKVGSTVLFKATPNGVSFVPCTIEEDEPFTEEEFAKIVKLSKEKGKVFKTTAGAIKYLRSLR
jgi:AbrB family looped-hinge helix DNA binding protein